MTTKKRLVLAVLAGTMVMFVWGAVSHLLLFKGAGFSRLPQEDRIIGELRRSIPQTGSTSFRALISAEKRRPQRLPPGKPSSARVRAGMIVYHPAGSAPVSGKKLLVQFLSHLMGAVVATFIASLIQARYWTRVLVVGLLGAFGPLTLGTISWNWYGFPDSVLRGSNRGHGGRVVARWSGDRRAAEVALGAFFGLFDVAFGGGRRTSLRVKLVAEAGQTIAQLLPDDVPSVELLGGDEGRGDERRAVVADPDARLPFTPANP